MEAVGEGKGLYQWICLPTWPVILCIVSLIQMHIIQAGLVEELEHAGKKTQTCASQEFRKILHCVHSYSMLYTRD